MPGRDKITPKGKDFFKQIKELKKLQVRVGFQHGRASDPGSGADLADVAAWNELGTEHSPPRPFLRQSVDNNADPINAMCASQLKRITNGQASAREALQDLGDMQKALVQNEIKTGSFEPNAPITISGGWMWRKGRAFYVKGKGSDRPLIDTGQLRYSVNFTIQKKGGG